MRRPHRCWPLLILGVLGIALTLSLSPRSALGQEPGSDSGSLARYVPKDNVVAYVEFQGLDAHADAWKKTAAYKILSETPTGEMLETVIAQLLQRLPAVDPTGKPIPVRGADLYALVRHMARSGFVFAYVANKESPKGSSILLVIRNGFKDKAIRATLAAMLQGSHAPDSKPQPVVRVGHKIIGWVDKLGNKLAWWVEETKKEDFVLLYTPPESADVILETLDGKRPSVQAHPKRAELLKVETSFVPNGLAFVDPKALGIDWETPRAKQFTKDYGYLGFSNVTSIDLRWGFQDAALMYAARLATSGPRQGLLALVDPSTFDKSKPPLIPAGVTGFTAMTVDIAGELDRLRAETKRMTPDGDAMIDKFVDLVKEKTKLRLKEDLLAHLGPKMAWYVLPATKKAAGPAGLAGKLGSAIEVPRFAMVIDVDNPTAFAKVLDQGMQALNRELKAMGKPPVAQPAKGARAKAAPGGSSFEFKANPGDTRSFTLQVPPELSAQIPATLRPTIRLGAKQVVIAASPEVARTVLEAKGNWAPAEDLAAAYKALPDNLKMISVSDPREVVPPLLATLPGKIQQIAAMAAMARVPRPPGANPAPPTPGPPPLVLQVDPAKLPSADAIKALLFPSLFTVESTPEEIRFTSRDAFPSFADPASAGIMTALLLPAVQAAREAARKAQARNMNLQPGAAGPARPGAAQPDGFFDVPALPPVQPAPAQPGPKRPGAIQPGQPSAPGRPAPGRTGSEPQ